MPQRDPKATQRSGEAKAKATSQQKRRGGAQIHTKIGSYTILKPLAKGGMAQIYQVRDERDKHIKALKLLHPTMSTDEALARLFSEVAPRFANRPGGYTRVIKAGRRRGDAAPQSIVELTETGAAAAGGDAGGESESA